MSTPVTAEELKKVPPGEWFDAALRDPIDAKIVREVVCGDELEAGIRIKNARIDGLLNLTWARGKVAGGGNALILGNCRLTGATEASTGAALSIDAAHSHLAGLALIDCWAHGVVLVDAVVDGDVQLDGLQPLTAACWVNARGLRVGGRFTARRAKLSLLEPKQAESPEAKPPKTESPEAEPPDTESPSAAGNDGGPTDYLARGALDLSEARIEGSLIFQPPFVVAGGICVRNAIVGGDIQMAGADLTANGIRDDWDALDAQLIDVKGAVFLSDRNDPLTARGSLHMAGSRIAGGLFIANAKVTHAPDGPDSAKLNLRSATISGSVWIANAEIALTELGAADVGSLLLLGTVASSLLAPSLRSRGDVTLCGALSDVELSNAEIGGDLKLGNGERDAPDAIPLSLTSLKGSELNLRLPQARVAGELNVLAGINTVNSVPDFDLEPGKRPIRMRETDLSCYSGWRLVQALLATRTPAATLNREANAAVPFPSGFGFAVVDYLYLPGSDRAPILLDGKSNPIHDLNASGALWLDTEDKVSAYVEFFCAHVWGDEGPFWTAGAPEVLPLAVEGAWAWAVKTDVVYGWGRFRATFRVEWSGQIEMTDDEPLSESASSAQSRLYRPPVRWYPRQSLLADGWPAADRWPPLDNWVEIDFRTRPSEARHAFARLSPSIETKYRLRHTITLSGARAACLADDHGQRWFGRGERDGALPPPLDDLPPVHLRLNGFTYDRLRLRHERSTARATKTDFGAQSSAMKQIVDPTEERKIWLRAQFDDYPPSEEDYRSHPYQQLASVLRSMGDHATADDIAFERLCLEKVKLTPPPVASVKATSSRRRFRQFRRRVGRPIRHGLWFGLIQIPIGFGLRPWRAVTTCAVIWAAGVLALILLSGNLKADTSSSAALTKGAPMQEVACGDHINKFLYPLDVMIPFIDLGQESRCRFAYSPGTTASWWRFWRWTRENWWLTLANGLYAIAGWAAITGLLFTLSGVVRRRLER